VRSLQYRRGGCRRGRRRAIGLRQRRDGKVQAATIIHPRMSLSFPTTGPAALAALALCLSRINCAESRSCCILSGVAADSCASRLHRAFIADQHHQDDEIVAALQLIRRQFGGRGQLRMASV